MAMMITIITGKMQQRYVGLLPKEAEQSHKLKAVELDGERAYRYVKQP